jgi:hypothetical protein
VDADAIVKNIRSTVTAASATCIVSAIVAPPAASAMRWCIGASGHRSPSEP